VSIRFRFRLSIAVLCSAALLSVAAAITPLPAAQVLVVGTYHFGNPGHDMANVQADDVLAPQRQQQLAALARAIGEFDPTLVAVEWPAELVETRYAQFLAGTLPESRNEVVQLGFRLAKQQGLRRVHGIDVDGDFPFEPVQAWAEKNGQGEKLGALLQQAQAIAARITEQQKTHTIGELLRELNSSAAIEQAQSFYAEILKFGAGDEQPGALLDGAWATRNYKICAQLLQALKPGDRAVVFYGQGHAHALQRCAIEALGVELVEAGKYLR
jgi:hypothetical protein